MEADQAIAAVLLAIAVDYQQIVHLEQQHSLMERVWKQGLHSLVLAAFHHILTLLQAMEAGQVMIAVRVLAMEVVLAIVADCQQIAHLEQQHSLMVHVWKADRRLIAMPIRAHQLNFSQVMHLYQLPRHMVIPQTVVSALQQITSQFGSNFG